MAYDIYQRTVASPRWETLAAAGAHPQRLLWASTGTKDPRYPDTYYVDALIGRDTVDTVPPATLDAFIDHGQPAARLGERPRGRQADGGRVRALGIDLSRVCHGLLADGVKSFTTSMTTLTDAIAARSKSRAAHRRVAKNKNNETTGTPWRRSRSLSALPNPLREGLAEERIPEPATMVIFGASGDLTRRKLFPALYSLTRDRLLPARFAVRRVRPPRPGDDAFREEMRAGCDEFARRRPIDRRALVRVRAQRLLPAGRRTTIRWRSRAQGPARRHRADAGTARQPRLLSVDAALGVRASDPQPRRRRTWRRDAAGDPRRRRSAAAVRA